MSGRPAYGKAKSLMAAVALLAACSVFVPQKKDSIVFSHRLHVEKEELECDQCHGEINRDAERIVRAVPGKPGCADCHEVEEKKTCRQCHTSPDSPSAWDRPEPARIIFSHQLHQKRNAACKDCHRLVALNTDIGPQRRVMPQHSECDNCHSHDLKMGRCRLCHQRLYIYPRKPENLYSHKAGFFSRHGRQAAAGGEEHCAQCHDQSYCAECHARTMTVSPALRFPDRVDRTFVHRGDYKSRHVIESRVGDTACLKCHGRSFCSACHERNDVGARLGTRNPHPLPFVHKQVARRRIAECAACHDQGPVSICARSGCHRSGGGRAGTKPHPPGWDPPLSTSERASHKMCSICH